MSRSETRRARESYTEGQDLLIKRMTATGCDPSSIAIAVGKTIKQIMVRAAYLKRQKSPAELKRMGWPIPDPLKINDWGPGFWRDNLVFPKRQSLGLKMSD